MHEILSFKHKILPFKKLLMLFLAVSFAGNNLFSEEAANIDARLKYPGYAYSKSAGDFNIFGLGVITLSFIGNNNKENSNSTGNFLMAAGVVSLLISAGLNGKAKGEIALAEKQFNFPTTAAYSGIPIVKPVELNVAEMKSAKAELAGIKGIEIQEGIEVERIIISANAQSLGFSSREETYFSEIGKENLKEIAAAIKKIDEDKVEVIGYTDDQGTEDQNVRISEARARNVVEFYVQKEGLSESKFTAVGGGSKNPVADNGDPEKRMQNNRVETVVVSSNVSKNEDIKKEVEKLNKIVGVGVKKEVVGVESVVTASEEAVSFSTASAEIEQKHRSSLESIGKMILSLLSDGSECTVKVKGHTDNVGTDAYNNELSKRRAQSVIAYFTGEAKIKPEIFESTGCGFQYPIASNDTEEGKAKNRRVEVIIVKKTVTAGERR